jgi:hypothetical protein
LQQTLAAIVLELWFGVGALLFFAGAALALLVPNQALNAMLGSVIAAYALAGAAAAAATRRLGGPAAGLVDSPTAGSSPS